MFPLSLYIVAYIIVPYLVTAQNDTEVVLRDTSNITMPDYVILEPPKSTRGVVASGTLFWPKNPTTGDYEIPIDISKASNVTKTRIAYVTGYLERATLIKFRTPTESDDVIVVVKEIPHELCWSTMGRPVGYKYLYMNLHPRVCTTLHMFMHEFLHLLGFLHEHERPDAESRYVNPLPQNWTVQKTTYYDELSVMSYPYSSLGPLKDPRLNELSKHRRTFLTRCDWSMLLALYPGKNTAPPCIPNYIPDVLKPTPDFSLRYGLQRAQFLCRYQNEFLFDTQLCVTTTGSRYPSLDIELGYKTSVRLRPNNNTLLRTSEEPSQTVRNGLNLCRNSQNCDFSTNVSLAETTNSTINLSNTEFYIEADLCISVLTTIQSKSFLPSCMTPPEEFCQNNTTTQGMTEWIKNKYLQCHKTTDTTPSNV